MSSRLSPGDGFDISAEGSLTGGTSSTSCGPQGWTETLQANLSVQYNGSHALVVWVHDATDAVVFEKTYAGQEAVHEDNQTFEGEPGEWTVRYEAQRKSFFDRATGDLWIRVYCGVEPASQEPNGTSTESVL